MKKGQSEMAPRVGIIGAGVAGLSVAMHLTSRGITDVTVFEAAFPAAGSSGLSVGDVSTLYETAADIDWRLEAMRFFTQIDAEVGLEMVGGLRIVYTEDDRLRLEAAAAAYADRGIEARVITPQEAGRVVPDLHVGDVTAALVTPLAGHLDATMLCRAYRERAESAGARVITSAPVTDAAPGPRSIALRTPEDTYQVDIVVNAAGPWAGRVAELLGTKATIHNHRSQVCQVRADEPLSYAMPQFQDSFAYVDTGDGLYIHPDSRSEFLIGVHRNSASDSSQDPDRFPRSIEEDYHAHVAAVLQRRFPGLADMRLVGGWSGLYPTSPDLRPIVGAYQADPRIVAAAGLGGAGVQLSVTIGRIAAEWITKGHPPEDPAAAALAPDRTMPGDRVGE
jgi:sarcosine oxidase subunit beta